VKDSEFRLVALYDRSSFYNRDIGKYAPPPPGAGDISQCYLKRKKGGKKKEKGKKRKNYVTVGSMLKGQQMPSQRVGED
jgi:hypothetical protein